LELRDKFRIFPYWNSPQPPVQKEYVRSLFDSIAYRYDLLNHLLSGGVDLYWRHRAIEHLRSLAPSRVLDVATGTGDFAIAALAVEPNEVVGVDIAEKMLNHGREKVRRRRMEGRITLQSGDAEHLEFDSGTFDAAIVAFGARNFEDLHSGLREMHRILRKGGRIVVLEFSRPRHFPFKQLYFFYFLRILPFIGRRISNHHAAYTYLPESVLRFPEGDEFLDVLRSVGFTNLTQERLTFGIATVYTGDT
jgi:demethylmenaquinone methyltransferase/2-methoxy-6-polyprenyl-1,4-benzoquinol methylase